MNKKLKDFLPETKRAWITVLITVGTIVLLGAFGYLNYIEFS